MRILLALGVLVLGFVATAEEAKRVGGPLPVFPIGMRTRFSEGDVKRLEQARKEAETKYNCIIAWSSAANLGINWAAGQGKPFIFNIIGGVIMKVDENGQLVKAGKKEQFEEIDWMFKRKQELEAGSRQQEAASKGSAPTDSGKGESTSLKTDQK